MRRLAALITALVLFIIIIISLDIISTEKAVKNNVLKPNSWYANDGRLYNNTDFTATQLSNSNTIMVMGSSELQSFTNTHPMNLFYKNQVDFNMILVGRAFCEDLFHATYLGALGSKTEIKKVVIILSPQWFSLSGANSNEFLLNYSAEILAEFLDNPNLSAELKTKVKQRVLELKANPINGVDRFVSKIKMNIEFNRAFESLPDSQYNPTRSYKDIDWASLMIQAEADGKALSDNNDFGIRNDAYNSFIKGREDKLKNSDSNTSFRVSKEYGDFKLFLDVCKELNIQPMVMLIPMNGYWYDYSGFKIEERTAYYNNIREICKTYNVQLADFSDKEYEKYFLLDRMHLGWKGWLYVNERICEFAEKNQ